MPVSIRLRYILLADADLLFLFVYFLLVHSFVDFWLICLVLVPVGLYFLRFVCFRCLMLALIFIAVLLVNLTHIFWFMLVFFHFYRSIFSNPNIPNYLTFERHPFHPFSPPQDGTVLPAPAHDEAAAAAAAVGGRGRRSSVLQARMRQRRLPPPAPLPERRRLPLRPNVRSTPAAPAADVPQHVRERFDEHDHARVSFRRDTVSAGESSSELDVLSGNLRFGNGKRSSANGS